MLWYAFGVQRKVKAWHLYSRVTTTTDGKSTSKCDPVTCLDYQEQPWFCPQHPHGNSQSPVTPTSGDPKSSSLWGPQVCMWYTDCTQEKTLMNTKWDAKTRVRPWVLSPAHILPPNTNKTLKPVFTHCRNILDKLLPEVFKPESAALAQSKRVCSANNPWGGVSVTRSMRTDRRQGSTLPPVQYQPWTWRRSTPWTSVNLWMCLGTSLKNVLWSQLLSGPSVRSLAWKT